jgi:hypothetical protein
MDLRETGCEDGRWMELAQDRVQLGTLVTAVFNFSDSSPTALVVIIDIILNLL